MIKRIVLIVFLGLLYNPFYIVAQDSIAIAEDIEEKKLLQFQEYFFKALSDKSINNYQKSIENLEACNEILPKNKSVYFELSKNYLLLNKTREATQYINKALLLEPTNTWMLLHLVAIQKKDRNYQKAIKTQLTIVQHKSKQRSELILLYYLNSEYAKALSLIYIIEKEKGLSTRFKQLKDTIELRNKPLALKVSKDSLAQLITDYKANKPSFSKLKKILILAFNENTEMFYNYSSLAVDLFPAQPFAYLSRGKALQLQKKHQEAIDILEIGIDFVIENSLLEAQFYTTLVKAYTSINNPRKVLEYKVKLKNHKI
tara:strand:+ start:318 stop:1262 length:945 start_codon:yes stop_codon:yes gene_type:complete